MLYYLLAPIIYGVSMLPFRVMYWLSDFLHFIIFSVVGYRKKVIYQNLKNSFPDNEEREIRSIQLKFQRYFCDLVLETIKTLTISEKEVLNRVSMPDTAVFEKYYKNGQSVIIVMGHFGNWELGGARFGLAGLHKLIVIYHPLKDKRFDKLVYHMRTRLGNELYARQDVLRSMIKDRERLTATAFIADQTPSPENAYWTTFLNQDTPIFTGTEKIARKFNYPIVYCSVFRTSRGKYEVVAEDLVEEPARTLPGEISELHTRRLEKDILKKPEIWLWSHKRWKYHKP